MAAGRAAEGAAAAVRAVGGMVAVEAAGLELPVGGGEERRTRGRKALPPRVFTILEPEKENKGGGGLQKMETGCEMNRKERKGLYIRRGGRGVISLKVIYFQSIFLIDLSYKKTDLYAGIWNNFTQSAV